MHEPRFITLETWVARTYGSAVTIATARRWVREGLIYPAPQKCGRGYFVTPDARYTDRSKPVKLRLIDRIHGTATA